MIVVEIAPVNAKARCREKGPRCRGVGTWHQMPAEANQRKNEKMLRIETFTNRSVVIFVCCNCMPAVLERFKTVEQS